MEREYMAGPAPSTAQQDSTNTTGHQMHRHCRVAALFAAACSSRSAAQEDSPCPSVPGSSSMSVPSIAAIAR